MTLASGTRLGCYEVLAVLGAGGMGEVYRARDTKLHRDVALKLLPEDFASDGDRLSRLRREAQVLASLNHPRIAAIHGLEESDGKLALVLELVEGEALDERLTRGPIPMEETLPIAKQMAEGLEAAHEKGIVHRDLKPSNLKLTKDGSVKILDFGLAKAIEGETNEPDGSQSPTLSRRMTEAGVILGTAGYMSPEQARGKAVDRRADIWAFGVVLFEMLSGRRLFGGETVSDTLAAVLRQEIDWKALPASTPQSVRRLLVRCLDRDPKQRLQAIGEARIAIDAREEATEALPRRRALPWALAGLGFTTALWLWALWPSSPTPVPVRVSAELGADVSLSTNSGTGVTLSPDGALLAFVARKSTGGPRQIYVRRLDELTASPLSGTEDATSPFFSPDGQWIAFFAGGKLKKVSVTGGAAVALCDAPNSSGGTWAEDGTIAFVPGSLRVSLLRVSSAGGTPEPLTTLEPGERTQRWPQMLRGGRAVLYTSNLSPTGFENANLVVQPLPDGTRKVLQQGGYLGRYVPSGHLVYMHEGTLFAAPFDLDHLELAGPPVPAVEGITANPVNGVAQFAFSPNGTLVYVPGLGAVGSAPIHWMDKEGKTTPLRATPANWGNIFFSPDGARLAMQIDDGTQADVWVYEWARDRLTRLTFGNGRRPIWTPDGRRIVFMSSRADKATLNLYWQRADGAGDAERLTESRNNQYPASWHPSGKFLALAEINPETGNDVMILPMEGDEASGWKPGKPTVFLNGPFAEREPMFSPDGRWLAYESDESGRYEVYVRPFPGPGGKWQISTDGGAFPTWSRTRRELFYSTGDERIMVAPYTVEEDAFRRETPRLWSERRFTPRGVFRPFDLHPDGERFALAPLAERENARQDKVVLIFNFFDELKRIAPVLKR